MGVSGQEKCGSKEALGGGYKCRILSFFSFYR